MQSLDTKVLRNVCAWLAQGQRVWLCTVIHTWGSAPRIPGSLLAHCAGKTVGSLSGGCVEDELLQRLQAGAFDNSQAHYLVYGGSDAENTRLQLPCGGKLGILLEPLGEHASSNFETIVAAIEQGNTICRTSEWPEGRHCVKPTQENPGVSLTLEQDSERRVPKELTQIYGPAIHLFIIGINDVSRHLARFALATGYRVTVCDPRTELHAEWEIDNVALLGAMPDDAIASHAADAHTAIVAVTHDPRIDDMGLMVAFDTPAFFIGAMGSKATSKKRRERLTVLGVTQQQMRRLHAPIGLDIGSKTPAEIAVSIMAQLIAERMPAANTK